MTAEDLLRRIREERVERLDLKVSDLLGRWHHVALAPRALTPALLAEGVRIAPGMLPAHEAVRATDLLLRIDTDSAVLDPVADRPTLSVLCEAIDADSGEPHPADPRALARRAEAALAQQQPTERATFGATVEFHVFEDVRFQQGSNAAFYVADSEEGAWNAGTEEAPNLGYKLAAGGGWGAAPPADRHAELRADIVAALEAAGVGVRSDAHGEGGAGHQSLVLAEASPVALADAVQWARYIARSLARRRGRVATFMPLPLANERPATMAVTQTVWGGEGNAFHDANGYGALSRNGRWYLGGLLKHGPAVAAFCTPTTNSYRWLREEAGAPVHLVYGTRHDTAAVRLPQGGTPLAGRIEYRALDAAANPYLAFSTLLLAGVDGLRNRIDPGDPLDRPLSEVGSAAAASVGRVPSRLEDAIAALAQDRDFLLQSGVFGAALLDTWSALKRTEAASVALLPTPREYELYFSG